MYSSLQRWLYLGLAVLLASPVAAQYTQQDSLRGSITAARAWWDLTYYHLDISVDPATQTIQGTNTVQYRVLEVAPVMQIDLQAPMRIERVEQEGQPLSFRRDGNVYWIDMPPSLRPGQVYALTIHYGGAPRVAKRAPWDGGFVWTQDENGNPYVATACQGDGASLWWPCKDHMYDEPDSMRISVRCPSDLVAVANGRLESTRPQSDSTTIYDWRVVNPINNYGVNVNLADYVHLSDQYAGEAGPLTLDYYVLRGHESAARRQFAQVQPMLAAFEHWFGPYPFYEDGYKLVEVPYLGMEHQSSVTYGNGFMNGYLGRDLSGTGWGLKFDFIIIHESGHEWFANNITYRDIADMWIHEGFTAYSENLFLDYHYGREAAADYVIGTRGNISNDRPIIGPYGVNREGSGDMYYKGANLLHTIRAIVDNDSLWRATLRGLNRDFYHQTVTTQQIETYLSDHLGHNLQPLFDQYLRTTDIPVLAYRMHKRQLTYRWENTVADFNLPLRVSIGEQQHLLKPTTKWQTLKLKLPAGELKVARDYYVRLKEER